MQDQLPIMHQIHTSSNLVDGTVELEFIDTWFLTGKITCLGVIAVLSVVDDLTEFDWLPAFGEVVAQSYRESNFRHGARWSREASRTTWASWSCVRIQRVQLYQQNLRITVF